MAVDNDDDDEGDGDVNDNELNQLLAYGEHAVAILKQIDKERQQSDAEYCADSITI